MVSLLRSLTYLRSDLILSLYLVNALVRHEMVCYNFSTCGSHTPSANSSNESSGSDRTHTFELHLES